MKRTHPLGTFRKDLKLISKRHWDLDKLHQVIALLQTNQPLLPAARPHKLHGQWAGHWECHIESDWLLIYKITATEVLLARTGTHADLFE